MINSIDFNCHGFTEYLCQERVEYAWMMQLLVGRVTGVVSPLQVSMLIILCLHDVRLVCISVADSRRLVLHHYNPHRVIWRWV